MKCLCTVAAFICLFWSVSISCMLPEMPDASVLRSDTPDFTPFITVEDTVEHSFTHKSCRGVLQEITYNSFMVTPFDLAFFKDVVLDYCVDRFSFLSQNSNWFDGNMLNMSFEQFSGMSSEFLCKYNKSDLFNAEASDFYSHKFFYAQKLFMNKNTKILTFTDIHGSTSALMCILANMINAGYINQNLIIRDDCILIGAGDYVDRRDGSLRVLLILLIIALKNPNKVVLLRGNHEDLNLNLDSHNIQNEICAMFDKIYLKDFYELLLNIYDLMPSVLYLALPDRLNLINDFLIFSHALIDFKFDPKKFLDFNNSELRESSGVCFCQIKQNLFNFESQLDYTSNAYGFVWHDVGIFNIELAVRDFASGRYSYNPFFIENFCRTHVPGNSKISGIIGGHDHYFANKIAVENNEKLISSVGFVKLDIVTPESISIKTGIFSPAKEDSACFLPKDGAVDCFSIVKFVSSPVDGINFKPTYLVINKFPNPIGEDLDWPWIYKAIECD